MSAAQSQAASIPVADGKTASSDTTTATTATTPTEQVPGVKSNKNNTNTQETSMTTNQATIATSDKGSGNVSATTSSASASSATSTHVMTSADGDIVTSKTNAATKVNSTTNANNNTKLKAPKALKPAAKSNATNNQTQPKPTKGAPLPSKANKATVATKKPSASAAKRPGNQPKRKIKVESSLTPPPNPNPPIPLQPPNPSANATINSPNLYEAMLGEISDLLMAAQEAQAFGRLKIASTYQLLVHARLIGLGKRFDRVLFQENGIAVGGSGNGVGNTNEDESANVEAANVVNGAAPSQGTNLDGNLARPLFPNGKECPDTTDVPPRKKQKTMNDESCGDGNAQSKISKEAAEAVITKYLPQDIASEINLDSTMMEHLARAAMELHHKRTGRGKKESRNAASKKSAVKAQTQQHVAPTSGDIATAQSIAPVNTPSPAPAATAKTTLKEKTSAPSRRGGRQKKPPSRAMLTVSDVSFDAKRILSGSYL